MLFCLKSKGERKRQRKMKTCERVREIRELCGHAGSAGENLPRGRKDVVLLSQLLFLLSSLLLGSMSNSIKYTLSSDTYLYKSLRPSQLLCSKWKLCRRCDEASLCSLCCLRCPPTGSLPCGHTQWKDGVEGSALQGGKPDI